MMNGFSQLLQNWWPRPNAGDKGELSRSHSREPTRGVGAGREGTTVHQASPSQLMPFLGCDWCAVMLSLAEGVLTSRGADSHAQGGPLCSVREAQRGFSPKS